LFAVSGAQAADLPVKAKAVEYVKICSLYGAGFFYIPGTDTCIKIGGYLRFEVDANAGGTFSPAVGPAGRADQHNWAFDRTSSELVTRQRMLWTYDVRTQTEYGTLRSYARTGIQWTTGDSVLAGSGAQGYLDRAFIQFGGFTFGKGVSFYDSYVFYPRTIVRYNDYGRYGYPTGELRLDVEPRDAQVYIDGAYAGLVDDFDGIFQGLRLEVGDYQVEVVSPGFEPLVFNVRIPPGEKVTYRGDLLPERP